MTASTHEVRSADDVPAPSSGPIATLRRLRHDPPATLLSLQREFGPIVRVRIPRVPLYLVSDPAMIQEALTRTGRSFAKGLPRRDDPTGDGDQPLTALLGGGLLTAGADLHKRQRRLMQPMFHRERIAAYATSFSGIAETTAAGWSDGATIDVHAEMTEMTLAIIARTVFDLSLETDTAAAIRRATHELSGAGSIFSGQRMGRFALTPKARRRHAAVADLHRVIDDLIADRRRGGDLSGDDLLSLLMATVDAETGEAMPDQQVHDEALTTILAGHETTANALSWAFHLLGTHPEVDARLAAELHDALGGRSPGIADLPALPFTAAVFDEAMRLYPPAWMMARRLRQEWDVCGYRLPPGSMLLMSPYVVHRDPQWWPEPDAFRPQRWLGETPADVEAAADRPRYAYFPFGGGPRQCIGNSFAQMEGVLCLAALAQRWRLTPTSDVAPSMLAAVTLRPKNGLPMNLHARGDRAV